MAYIFWRLLQGQIVTAPWYFLALLLIVLCAILACLKNLPEFFIGFMLALGVVATLFASGVFMLQGVHLGYRFNAFNVNRICAVAITLLAPRPFWSGFLITCLCIVATVGLYWALPHELRGILAMQEPWTTASYSALGFIVLYFRIKGIQTEQKLRRVNAEIAEMNRIATVSLAVRDLANSPIQALYCTTALMNVPSVSRQKIVGFNEDAIKRLKELGLILGEFEQGMDWSNYSGSFDAVSTLRAMLRGKERERR